MALAAAAAIALACSKGGDGGPRLRSILPAQGAEGTAVTIRIEGDGLEPHVLTDYGDAGASLVDARFRAWLGTMRLRDVRSTGDGALSATVPEDLPAGTYDLAVEDPAGNRGTLPAAFRVLAPSDAGALVASFRVDPVAAQVAGAPFAVTVTALDASGQVVTGFSGSVALSDRTGALVPASIGPFAWGAWTGPVEVRAPVGADALAVADSLGHAGTSNDFAVMPPAAARVVFASPSVDTVAGACAGPVIVALEDLYGAPTAAVAPVDVAISGGAAAVYADAACAVPAPGATVAAGGTAASVYVRSTLATPFVIDATAAGLDPGAQPGLVRPAAPARLVFTTAPQTVTAGACSAAATLRAEDAYGNVSPAPADTAVALSSTAAGGLTFHDAAGCAAAAVPAVTLPASGSAATFWFRGTAAQAVTLTAAGAGIAGAGTQGETVVPALPVALAFATASQTVAAGSCSGAATVEARDAFGNPAPVPAATLVALAAAPAAPFTFHLDPACGDAPIAATAMPAGASQASFRFRATATGLYDVSATGAGLPGVATQAETIGPAAADRVVFTSAPKAVKAGQCSGPLTVEVRDGLGNAAPVASATAVALAASPSAGTALFASTDCSGPGGGPATIPAGAATATFSFRSTAAGTFDATATAAGLLPGTQAETVQPEAPDRLVFTTAPVTATAGICSSSLTVEARDAYGNVAPVAALTAVSLAAAPGTAFSFFDTAGCGAAPVGSVSLAAGASSQTFWFRGTAAGVVSVTATGAGIATAATQPETIVPAAPDRLVFTTGPQATVAGSCSGAAIVQALDLYGNPAPVASATAVSLAAAPATGFAFYDTAGCSAAAVPSVSLAAGASSQTLWFRGTTAGTVTVTATGAGIPAPAAQAETIVPAAPDRLVFTTSPQTVTAGSCSGAATVQALDAYGNLAPVSSLTAVSLAAAPAAGLAFHDTAGCGAAAVTSVSLAAGASSQTFWFRGTVAGTVGVTATGAGIALPATQAETIVPGAPDRLVFTTPPQSLTAGSCSAAATVEARDLYGNVAPVSSPTAVSLVASPPTGFAFHDTAGCGAAAVASVGLAAGASTQTFWFRGTVAGGVTVTATGTGIATAATQAETVQPGAPDRLVFTTAAQTLTAGACSGAVTVEARDLYGNVAPVSSLTAISLAAAPPAGFAFYDSAGCGAAAVTSVSLAAGASSQNFWFRGTTAGTVTVTATGTGIPTAATQAETIQPGAPDRLVFTTSPQTLAAGSCSGVATVEARDVYGNVAPVSSPTAISLAASPPAGFAFHDTAGCGAAAVSSVSLAAGASSQTFWFRGTVAGGVIVTATGAGIATPATQSATIQPGAPDRLVLTAGPQTLPAGSCSGAATVEARDVYGNLAPVSSPTAISLAAAPLAGFAFHDTAGCGAAAVGSVSLAAGASSQIFWFRGTVAGGVTVTATGAGIATPATQAETIVPAAPDRLVFTTSSQALTAGSCSGATTVEAHDVYGNIAPVSSPTAVSLAAAPPAGFAFYDTAGCGAAAVTSVSLAAGASSQTFWFRGTVAGGVTVTATGAGIATPATQAETIVPGAPDRLVFTTSPQSLTAGTCSGAATVQALDVHGNLAPVSSLTAVSLAASPPAGFAFYDTAGCGAAGVSSVNVAAGASTTTLWFRGTAAGTVDVTATGAGIPTAATQAETIGPAAPDRLVFTTAAQTLTAGSCSGAATVEARDVYGNVAPVASPTAISLAAAPTAGFAFFDTAGCGGAAVGSVSLTAGASSQNFWFRGTAAGGVTVTATGAGIPTVATQAETIQPGAPDKLVFTTAAQTLTAGSCSGAATVEARDLYGNVAPVASLTTVSLAAAPGTGFAFHDTAGCATAAVSSVSLATGASSQTFWFRGTAAGGVTVTATGAGIATPATQAETIVPGAPDRLVFTTAPQALTAGNCSGAATVQALDVHGNAAPVASLTAVSLAASPPTGFAFYAAASCGGSPVSSVDLAAGASSQTFWFRGTASGTVTVTATGAGIPAAATQPETIQPGAPDKLVFTTAPQALTAGSCSGAATVEAHDVYGNVAPVSSLTAIPLAAAPSSGFAFYDTAGCSAAQVTSVSLAAGASTQTFWFRGTAAGSVAVTATGTGIPTGATQAETIQPGAPDKLVFTTAAQTLTAGTCSGATVEARDLYGNVAPVSSLTAISLAPAPPAGFAFYDTAGCATAAVSSVSLAAGASSQTFWFRGTATGSFTVTAAGAGIPTAATQVETIQPGAPDRLVFTTAAQTLTAGNCSGAATVEARDLYGNVAPVSSLTAISLTAAPPAGFAFYDTAGCSAAAVSSVSLSAGASSQTFWFRGTAAGSVAVTATGTGIPTGATQAEAIQPAAPDKLVFTTAAQTLTAGTCSGVATLEARDLYGNVAPVSSLTAISLAAAPPAGFAFYDTAGCGAAAVASVSLAAGASTQTFWFRGTAAGTVTVTATGAGIAAPATQAEAIQPGPPEKLVFTTAAQTLVAGNCSGAATVEARDLYGNVAPVASLTTVSLTAAPGTGFAFHDTAGCSTAAVTSVSIAAGASSQTFWFRGTTAGTVTVTATGSAIATPAAQAETIQPAAPDKLVFTTGAQTLTAGSCSGAATVEARDLYGNVAPVASLTAVSLAAAPATGFAFYAAATCSGSPVTSVDLAAGASSQTFWFRGTAAAGVTVTATGAGIPAAASQAETIQPGAPDKLVLTTVAQTLTAGNCSGGATVEAHDVYGNVAPVSSLTAISLTAAPPAGFAFYDAAGCSAAAVSSVSLAAGASSQTFWFRGTATGSFTVTAAGAGIPTAATQVETIQPGAPDRLVFTTAAQTLTAGNCSGAATVEARDLYGNVAPVASLTTVPLAAVPATGFAFYAAATCSGSPVTSVDLAAGASSQTFWFRGTAAGTVTVTATGAGIATPATQAETIQPSAPDKLVFTTAAQTLTAGNCSGGATVEAHDVYGNVAPVSSPTAASLAAVPPIGFAFYDTAGCSAAAVTSVSLAVGASSQTFWFRGTVAGGVTVTATGAGIATPATQAETIVPGAPDKLVFTTSSQTLTAGSCSGAATVQALDVHGNVAPVSSLTAISLAAAPSAGFAFYDAAGCSGAPVTSVSLAAGGSAQTFWFRGTAAGTVTVTATGAGIPTAATQPETIQPGAPDRLVFTSAPQAVNAGACSAAVTVQALDVHGNVAPVAALTPVALSAAPGAGFAFHDTAGCGAAAVTSVNLAPGASSTTFWFRGTVAAGVNVTATGAGIPNAATQAETVNPAAPDRLVITTAPQAVTAGACSGSVTLTVLDTLGNVAPVSSLTAISLAAAPATGFAFYDTAGCGASPVTSVNLAAGTSTQTFWFRGTGAGTVTVTATGAGIPTPGTQSETVNPAAPDRLVFTSSAQTVTAGACSAAATLEARDLYGNVTPVAALTSVALSAAPANGFAFYAAASCGGSPVTSVDLAAGTSSQTFWFRGTAAGAVTVGATGTGIPTAGSQSETILPDVPDRLVFTTAPQTVTAGSCSAAVTLQARDVHGNVAPVAALTAVTLSAAPATGFAFYDTAGCGSAPVTSVSLAAGTSGQTFWFRGTKAGTVTLTASGAGIATPATQAATIVPAAPDRLVFTSAPQTTTAGTCSASATLEARDPYGNVAPVAGLTTVSLAAVPATGFAFHDTAGCGAAAVTSVNLAAGASSQTFWFRGTAAGTVTVTAMGAGIPTPATQAETVSPAAPDRLVFTTAAQAVTAGACSAAATVEARDLYGNAAPVSAPTAVSLAAAPATGFAFYDAAGCGAAAVSSVSLAAGASSQTFWFRGTAAGAVTATATGAGIPTAATQAETVNPAAPDRLVFTTAQQTVTAGACSAAATVEARDVYGNAAPVAALTSISLTAAPATGFGFYDTAGCGGAPVGSVNIAAGASSQTFWFRGTAAGAVTVTATGAGIPTAASQGETVNPATPAAVVFTSAPQTITAGTCSGTTRVELRDAYANPTASAADVSLALGGAPAAGTTFYEDPGCVVPVAGNAIAILAGQVGKDFWFKATAAGPLVVTSAPALLTSASQTETIQAAAPAQLVFTTGAQSLTAGTCSAVATVQAQDTYGNVSTVAANTSVSLAAAPAAGFTFYASAGCGGGSTTSVTILAGQSTASLWFRGTAAGSVTVTATGTGIPTAATQTETVSAAAPAMLVFTTGTQSLSAGTCSAVATVQAQDTHGNVSTVAANTSVSLAAAPAAGFTFYSSAGCGGGSTTSVTILAGQSTASLWFRGTAAGSVTVTATGTGIPTAASQGETVNPATPAAVVFTSAPQTITAGACSGTTRVELRDAYANPTASAADVSLALGGAPAAGTTFYEDPGCVVPVAGNAIAILAGQVGKDFWFKATAAGPLVVTSAPALLTSASQTETIQAAAPAQLVFTTGAQSLTAGTCSAVATVQAQDTYGNVSTVAANTSVSLAAAPAAGFTFYASAGCGGGSTTSVTILAGQSTASLWFRGTAAGSVTVTATGTGIPTAATQTETVSAAAPAMLVFTTGTQSLSAGTCSAVATVQAQDTHGNVSTVAANTSVSLAAAPAAGFTFYSSAGCGGGSTTSVTILAGQSTASLWFRGTAAGSVTVTATGTGIPTAASQTETVLAAAPAQLVFTTGTQSLAAGTCSAVATVQAQDTYGNVSTVAANTAVSLAAAPAAGFTFYAAAGCGGGSTTSVTILAGQSTASLWFRGTAAGSVTVTATGTGIATPATQTETVSAAAPAKLVFTTGTQSLTAGTCSAVATVQAQDTYGNVSTVAANTAVALAAAPAGGFTFYAAAGCGGGSTTSVTILAGQSTASLWFRGTAAGSVTVTATGTGIATPATQTETVSAAAPAKLVFTTGTQSLTAGTCSAVATVQAQDTYGNVSTVAANTAVALAAAPAAGFTFYAAAGCGGGSTTSVTILAGQSTASLWFRGTAAGSVTVTATGTGIATPATQAETITAGPLAAFTWDPIASPQALGSPFAVTVRGVDAYGNAQTSFTGTAALVTLPAGLGLQCVTSCSGATTTSAFAAGVWSGTVSVGAQAAGIVLTATSGGSSGTSNAFDVLGAGTPPTASFTATPRVVVDGSPIAFDASASSDPETPAASLRVSWDFAGTATGTPDSGAGWTAWTTTKTASFTYPTSGTPVRTFAVRLAVQDQAGNISYATHTVVVVSSSGNRCVVTSAAVTDDGTNCAGVGGNGLVTLPEAIRSAGGNPITFSGPMTISGNLNLNVAANIYAQAGVKITGQTTVSAAVLLSGVELAVPSSQSPGVTVSGGSLTLEDAWAHDMAAIEYAVPVTVRRTLFQSCAGDCLLQTSSAGTLAVSGSEFRTGAAGVAAIRQPLCSAAPSLTVDTTVFSAFPTAIDVSCSGTASTLIVNNTFHANGTGIVYAGLSNALHHTLRNNVFTSQTVNSVTCAGVKPGTWVARDYHVLNGNAADACVATDPNTLTSSPQYIDAAGFDFRLTYGSPAVDTGFDTGLDLNGAAPGNFFGSGPDRGGRETW